MILEVCIFLLTLLAFMLWTTTWKPKNFPPGPPRLPIVGSLPFVRARAKPGKEPTLTHGILQNVEKYGVIHGFWQVEDQICVIADFDTLKDVMKEDVASGRPDIRPLNTTRPGFNTMIKSTNGNLIPGLVFSEGPYWADQRKFVRQTLSDLAFGGISMEDRILLVVQQLCSHLASYSGKVVGVNNLIHISILNSFWTLLTGKMWSLDDPTLIKSAEDVTWNFDRRNGETPFLNSFLPKWMKQLAPVKKLLKLDRTKHMIDEMLFPLGQLIEEHATNLDGRDLGNFVDAYLAKVAECSDPKSGFYQERGRYSLLTALLDIFIAGVPPTSNSLAWTILHVLHRPDVKAKLHEEIDRVLKGSPPTLSKQAEMPYSNAVLWESLRVVSFAALAIPHKALADIKVNGYVLPKGTILFPSLVSVMHNPKRFPEPDSFKPERFLTSDGRFHHNEHVVPFGTGKRQCTGQAMAEKQLFLFFVGMMQKFDFSNPPGGNLPSPKLEDIKTPGSIRVAPAFEALITQRG